MNIFWTTSAKASPPASKTRALFSLPSILLESLTKTMRYLQTEYDGHTELVREWPRQTRLDRSYLPTTNLTTHLPPTSRQPNGHTHPKFRSRV